MPASPYNVYVYLRNGRVAEVANVTAYAIISPVFMDGTYRDTPPVIGGAGAVMDFYYSGAESGVVIGPATIAGGVQPTISSGAYGLTANSSVLQDDRYIHKVPRYALHPEALLVFTTTNGGTLTYPTATIDSEGESYAPSTAEGSFDAVFRWRDVKGWSNTAPQGWVSEA